MSTGVLAGRAALVTGAGRGIGRAIALRLAAEGAAVAVVARTTAEIEQTADDIDRDGGVAVAVTCDITDDRAVADMVGSVSTRLQRPIDTLVNNAGVYMARRFADHTIEDWQRILDVNVLGTVRITRALLPMLIEQPRSRIINIASVAGKKGSLGQTAYNASKHAQIGITRCLAVETGHTGLRVNAVCPGFTPTELLDLDGLGAVHGTSGQEVLAGAARAATIGRLVTLDEIAAAVCYLAGPAADGINGQSLVVDGGVYMN